MAVLTGSGEFYDSMHAFSANNWEQNHLAELHIRKVLEMHVPNLKNDEYKEPPKAKKTDEENNQGNSKNSRTYVGQKLKRDGTPDRRCKQAREYNATNGESNTPRTENKNQKRGRSISEKKNQTISPIISPDVGKKLRREEKTATNQPSILSFLTKLNTESISKPDIDVQKYFNINDNVEIVTEENTQNEEIFEEALNQKESLQSNIETKKIIKQRDGVEAEANYKEGDHTSASSSTVDSTKEDPNNTLHKELHDNYLNNLHMMYERLTRLEIIDENSLKNIEFLTKNISKFTSHMEGTVAGLIHGTMVIYLQNSLSKITEHHKFSHKKLQNEDLKVTDEKNQIRKMEQRLEDMQSEIKTLKSQIEGSNKPQKERIDEEDTKSDEKHETSYKNEELHRTITEKVDTHSKKIQEQIENLKSWTEKELETVNIATKSIVNREIRDISNQSEQQNSERMNELLINNARLTDQLREQGEIFQKKYQEVQEKNKLLEERLCIETSERRFEMKNIHLLFEQVSHEKSEGATNVFMNISKEFKKLNVSNSLQTNNETQDARALIESIVKEQNSIVKLDIQKQIDCLSTAGEQLKESLEQQDLKLKNLIKNWATEGARTDQK